MQFNILRDGKKVSRPGDYYINGEGILFYDCDPHGVDMSSKRRIIAVDTDRFSVEAVESVSNQQAKAKHV